MYESQRSQLSSQAFNMEQTVFAINTVKDTHTTIAAMKQAATTLKVENKKINLSEIENVQDELEDMFEDMNEVNDVLSRSYGVPEAFDECDLEAELAGLEFELGNEELITESTAAVSTAEPTYILPTEPNGQVHIDREGNSQSKIIDTSKLTF